MSASRQFDDLIELPLTSVRRQAETGPLLALLYGHSREVRSYEFPRTNMAPDIQKTPRRFEQKAGV